MTSQLPFPGMGLNFAIAPTEPYPSIYDSNIAGAQIKTSDSVSPPVPTLSSPEPKSAAAQSMNVNPRSCTLCRKRKVKCDRHEPCGNCVKASAQCIFPGPGRAPRRSKKPENAEIQAKLQRLENIVKNHIAKGDELDFGLGGSLTTGPLVDQGLEGKADSTKYGFDGTSGDQAPKAQAGEKTERIGREFGRLQIDEGRSRYISNKSWNVLSEGFAELRDILDDPTDDEEDYPSPGASSSSASTNNHGYLFGFSSTATSLRNLHPPAERIMVYWSIFKTNVDPVFKVLHIPTSEQFVLNAALNLDRLTKSQEVFMFSIYFAAVTSLSKEECQLHLGIDKHSALKNYRFATEQAFARCQFFNTQELIVTQALLMFLVCVRRTDDSRYVWIMTGVLIRLALVQGINRDGTNFKVKPLTTELRRRLWWQIVTLDVKASDDQGSDPTIMEQTYDTRHPLNINDEDISPSMDNPPKEREGPTEMTFDLMRYAVSTTMRRLTYAPPGPGPCKPKEASLGLSEREKMIDDLHQLMQQKFLKGCNIENDPLHWVIATVAKIITSRMWLMVHYRPHRSNDKAGSSESEDRFFKTALEMLQLARRMETDERTKKWAWMFKTYTQWHALGLVVSELCVRTSGPDVEAAWTTIDDVIENWDGFITGTHRGMMFKPLRNLISRARKERAKELRKQVRAPQNGTSGPTVNPAIQSTDLFLNGGDQGLPQSRPFDSNLSAVARNDSITSIDDVPMSTFSPFMNGDDAQGERLKQNIDNWMFAQGPPPMMLSEDSSRGWADASRAFPPFSPDVSMTDGADGVNGINMGPLNEFTNWY